MFPFLLGSLSSEKVETMPSLVAVFITKPDGFGLADSLDENC